MIAADGGGGRADREALSSVLYCCTIQCRQIHLINLRRSFWRFISRISLIWQHLKRAEGEERAAIIWIQWRMYESLINKSQQCWRGDCPLSCYEKCGRETVGFFVNMRRLRRARHCAYHGTRKMRWARYKKLSFRSSIQASSR